LLFFLAARGALVGDESDRIYLYGVALKNVHRLQHGQIGRLGSFMDAAGIKVDLAARFGKAGAY
jgi:hypothetical protein